MLEEVESMAGFDLDIMEQKVGSDWGKQCTT